MIDIFEGFDVESAAKEQAFPVGVRALVVIGADKDSRPAKDDPAFEEHSLVLNLKDIETGKTTKKWFKMVGKNPKAVNYSRAILAQIAKAGGLSGKPSGPEDFLGLEFSAHIKASEKFEGSLDFSKFGHVSAASADAAF